MRKNINREIIYKILINIFLILFVFFPLLIVFKNTKVFYPSVVITTLIVMFLNWKNFKILDNKRTILFIVISAFLLRIGCVLLLNSKITQVSDFYSVFVNASEFQFPTFYFQTAYHYFYYTFINGILYKIFGAHQIVSLLFNAIITSSVTIVLYKVCIKIFNNVKIANLAALFYVFWPSMIFYNLILTPDHLAVFFMLFSIYNIICIMEKLNNKEVKNYKYWIRLITSGISISLIGFFKNFSPVILLAFFIILILLILIKKAQLKISIISLTGLIIIYFITNACLFAGVEYKIGGKVLRNQVWQYMYVGLGISNEGAYSQERYGEFHQFLIEHNMDIKATNKHFSKKIIKEIKENYSLYPWLLEKKTVDSFGNDIAQLYWVKASINNNNQNSHFSNILERIILVNQGCYIVMLVFVLIASIYNIYIDKNNALLFINIVIFGCCMLLLLAESQGRYKYAFEPLLAIMAAYGLYYGKTLINKCVLQKEKGSKI